MTPAPGPRRKAPWRGLVLRRAPTGRSAPLRGVYAVGPHRSLGAPPLRRSSGGAPAARYAHRWGVYPVGPYRPLTGTRSSGGGGPEVLRLRTYATLPPRSGGGPPTGATPPSLVGRSARSSGGGPAELDRRPLRYSGLRPSRRRGSPTGTPSSSRAVGPRGPWQGPSVPSGRLRRRPSPKAPDKRGQVPHLRWGVYPVGPPEALPLVGFRPFGSGP